MSEIIIGEGGEVFDGRAPVFRRLAERWSSSKTLGALAVALAKAQGAIRAAAKDSMNPHFRSKYADFAAIREACQGPLSENGLAVLQPLTAEGDLLTVSTILLHESGEWISSALTLPAREATVQALGSAATYGRRYGLASLLGISSADDDDGEAASGRGGSAPSAPARAPARVSMSKARSAAAVDLPVGEALDVGGLDVVVAGRSYRTAGVTGPTLERVWSLSGGAAEWLREHGLKSSLDLSESVALALLESVAPGSEDRGSNG